MCTKSSALSRKQMYYSYEGIYNIRNLSQLMGTDRPPFEAWLPTDGVRAVQELSQKVVEPFADDIRLSCHPLEHCFTGFQFIWMEVVDKVIDTHPNRRVLDNFLGGGRVQQELMGQQLAAVLQPVHAMFRSRQKRA
jgi:hypothetical protein